MTRRLLHHGLRVVSHAEPGGVQHRQVVRTVPDGNGLLSGDPLAAGNLLQKLGLAVGIDDFPFDLPGHHPVPNLQRVGIYVVDAELVAQTLANVLKAT